jgi:hypothetical protein
MSGIELADARSGGRGLFHLLVSDICKGPHREVQTCVAKGFTELIFCADIPLHPGNE